MANPGNPASNNPKAMKTHASVQVMLATAYLVGDDTYARRDQCMYALHVSAYVLAGYEGGTAFELFADDEGAQPLATGWGELCSEDTNAIYHNGELVATFLTSARGGSFRARLEIGGKVYAADEDSPVWCLQ